MISKSFLKSTTIWGGIVLGVKALAMHLGMDLDDSAIEAVLAGLVDALGVWLVFRGRAKASQPVHFLPNKFPG